jgi:hypothetical protein
MRILIVLKQYFRISSMYVNKQDESNNNKHSFQNLQQHIEYIIYQMSDITNCKCFKNSNMSETRM